MKILGVDPSSSVTGIAVLDAKDLSFETHTFKADHNKELQDNMNDCLFMLENLCRKPYAVGIEKVSVSWNVNTIRKISYYEALGLLHAANTKASAHQLQATKARRIVLSKGTLSKEDSFKEVISRFPDHEFANMDEADALVIALAAAFLEGISIE